MSSKGQLEISKSYLLDAGNKVRLCANISGAVEICLYYEVDMKYRLYLDTDTSDAFLLMLIEYCQIHNYDMKFEGLVTERLLDYVNEYYVPVLAEQIKKYNVIRASSETIPFAATGQAVGTGFSAGVDSFYTVYKLLRTKMSTQRLTHVLFANVGSQTYEFDQACRIFQEKTKKMESVVREIDSGIEFVEVNSNCLELYADLIGRGFTGPDARKTCSCVVALRKLFSSYYFSNGVDLDRFSFSEIDPAFYDLFSVDMLNKSGITFYLRGIETPSRIEKIKYFVDEEPVRDNLSVCIDKNCGICSKCVRTQLELLALKKLDDYRSVFDIDRFKKNFVIITAKYLAEPEEHKVGFVREIRKEAKKNKVHLPVSAYVLSALYYFPLYVAKRCVKKLIRRY